MTNSTKITTYLLCIFFLFGTQLLSAQCGTGKQVRGGVVTPYWRGEGQNDPGVPIPDMSSGQYALVKVIKGVQYEINAYWITICRDSGGEHSIDESNWSSAYTRFTAEVSGQVRVYYTGGKSGVRIKIIGGANNIDAQNSYHPQSNRWRTHFYREIDNFTNYLGYKDYNSHSFHEHKDPNGDSTPIDIYSQGNIRAGILRYFSARSFMQNIQYKGFYYVRLGADDGTRLFINDEKVYDRWNPTGDYSVKNQAIKLTGNDLLKYEYFNNNIPLQYVFEISPTDKIIENKTLTSSNGTKICMGKNTTLDGDGFATALPNTFTNPVYQWYYATSPTGVKHPIGGNTKYYEVNTNTSPFNQAGSYYFFREARITINNIGVVPKTESIMSDFIKIDVLKQLTAKAKPNKKSFCQRDDNAKIIVTVNNGSGGQPPFTFNYTIDGVTQPPIHSNNHIFEIPINTSQAGTFEYKYISITDGNNCITKLHSIDPITINPLPTADFSGQNTTLCLNTPETRIPWVTFTGELPFTVRIRGTKTGGSSSEKEITLEDNENRLTIEHNPNDEGEFTYELLWVRDNNGCKTLFSNKKIMVNVEKPSITTPQDITWCLPEITQAIYQSNGDVNISENAYTLVRGSKDLDVTINPVPCCPNPVLKWTINNDLSNVRTGQPSAFAGTISFENNTATDKIYTIYYWLECNGQSYSHQTTRQVRITPRPVIEFE
ncbi:hypothetical protein [Capnocytophaga felis]|uniref:PA14 domain-containing protein n=1 Tax=Capnocytophaga felis TaxID=2267611 RepID=A0A5M4B6K0_9FLAO|nr:hypothetical protein [Capnocytophaga felis]GET45244.1 hypothetical protein RCZ01_05460 [Capnocytophaga felis]GET47593.1 hypothetical protein RCZ02_04240 [Capnocytophaga felis]